MCFQLFLLTCFSILAFVSKRGKSLRGTQESMVRCDNLKLMNALFYILFN